MVAELSAMPDNYIICCRGLGARAGIKLDKWQVDRKKFVKYKHRLSLDLQAVPEKNALDKHLCFTK